jgi:large subunit ribosomal protein L10
MLSRAEKEALVSELKEKIEKANALFLTNLVGVGANDSAEIRKNVRDAAGAVVVTKNTLFRLASEGTYAEELLKDLKGTNAIALAFEDAPAVAKAVYDASEDNDVVSLRDGFLRGKTLTADEVIALAKLPSRDEMLATLLATFNAPVSAFARVMHAIMEKKDEGAETVESTPVEVSTEETAPEAKTEEA